jgi:hypothetical protein
MALNTIFFLGEVTSMYELTDKDISVIGGANRFLEDVEVPKIEELKAENERMRAETVELLFLI